MDKKKTSEDKHCFLQLNFTSMLFYYEHYLQASVVLYLCLIKILNHLKNKNYFLKILNNPMWGKNMRSKHF